MNRLLALMALACAAAFGQSLTTVTGTIKNADGTLYTGQATFIAQSLESAGVSVRSAPIRLCSSPSAIPSCPGVIVNGALTIQLTANDAVYPLGTPYYVVFQPTRGTPYSEYWGVNEGGPFTIKQVLQVTAPAPGATINTLRSGTATPPSNSLGANGDFYLNTATHCLYGAKASAVWPTPCLSLYGPAGGVGPAGPPVTFRGTWLIGTAYSTGDAVAFAGSSYIALSGNTGLQPDTNPSQWSLLASIGNTGGLGLTGPAGAGYTASSTTTVGITMGSKAFTLPAGLAYSTGARVRASYTLDTTQYMEGVVGSYSGATLIMLVDTIGGSGVKSYWNINLAGVPGLVGPAGPAPAGSGFISVTGGVLNTPISATGSGNVVEANSPALTGGPTTPTQSALDNSTKIASTAYTDRAIAVLCNTCTVGPVCWSGANFIPCSTTALSWAALTSSQWSSLTSGGWAAMTH